MQYIHKLTLIKAFGLSTLVACGPAESPSFETKTSGIIDGTASKNDAHPSVGVMLVKEDFDGEIDGGMNCSGTLIAPDVVLTAAHCLIPEQAAERENPGLDLQQFFSFASNVENFQGPGLALPANSHTIIGSVGHPDFVSDDAPINEDQAPENGLGKYHDIGLLFLASPVTKVTPTPIADATIKAQIKTGAPVTIVGYGQRSRSEYSEDAGLKYEGETYIHDINEHEMQVGGTQNNTAQGPSKCYGDSGGPTFLTVNNQTYVVGVTSRSYNGHAECDVAGVDTRVDAYAVWIKSEMEKACQNGLRKCKGASANADSNTQANNAAGGNSANQSSANVPSAVRLSMNSKPRTEATGCSTTGSSQTWVTILFVLFGLIWFKRKPV